MVLAITSFPIHCEYFAHLLHEGVLLRPGALACTTGHLQCSAVRSRTCRGSVWGIMQNLALHILILSQGSIVAICLAISLWQWRLLYYKKLKYVLETIAVKQETYFDTTRYTTSVQEWLPCCPVKGICNSFILSKASFISILQVSTYMMSPHRIKAELPSVWDL